MAYDELLADRIAATLAGERISFKEKKMFGGVAFMVKNKMCVGIAKQDLMVRFDPDRHDEVLGRKGAREMDFTGRPMRGYVFVDPSATHRQDSLRSWIRLALEYNTAAKRSPKRKRS